MLRSFEFEPYIAKTIQDGVDTSPGATKIVGKKIIIIPIPLRNENIMEIMQYCTKAIYYYLVSGKIK